MSLIRMDSKDKTNILFWELKHVAETFALYRVLKSFRQSHAPWVIKTFLYWKINWYKNKKMSQGILLIFLPSINWCRKSTNSSKDAKDTSRLQIAYNFHLLKGPNDYIYHCNMSGTIFSVLYLWFSSRVTLRLQSQSEQWGQWFPAG